MCNDPAQSVKATYTRSGEEALGINRWSIGKCVIEEIDICGELCGKGAVYL
jgi:hypothetical protein